jgi:hypothetical protein
MHIWIVPEMSQKKSLAEAADEFNKASGLTVIDSSVKPFCPRFALQIANAYEKLEHNPSDPQVKASYDSLKQGLKDQWDFSKHKIGITFEPWNKAGQPYANSKEMFADLNNNGHLYFFPGGDMRPDHPLAEVDPETGHSYNNMLRVVHDIFGHAANHFQFGPKGEENAYVFHCQMFSVESIPALTTETRGQNSWVNFGPHLLNNKGKLPLKGEEGYIAPPDRPFAEQKAGLLPKEFYASGLP